MRPFLFLQLIVYYFMKTKLLYFSIIFSFIYTQDIFTEYLVVENDTIDVFSYQIPQNYNNNLSHPLQRVDFINILK